MYGFYSKKNILIPNVAEKNILILVEEKKKCDSEFLSYNQDTKEEHFLFVKSTQFCWLRLRRLYSVCPIDLILDMEEKCSYLDLEVGLCTEFFAVEEHLRIVIFSTKVHSTK
jgi:hypothetical protein